MVRIRLFNPVGAHDDEKKSTLKSDHPLVSAECYGDLASLVDGWFYPGFQHTSCVPGVDSLR